MELPFSLIYRLLIESSYTENMQSSLSLLEGIITSMRTHICIENLQSDISDFLMLMAI